MSSFLTSEEFSRSSASGADIAKVHGILMTLAWCVFVVPAVLIARYFKKISPFWFRGHWIVNVVALLMMLTSLILIILDHGSFHGNAHSVVGILVIVLALFQGVLGQVANMLWYEGKPPSFPDKLHWYLGRVVLLLAITNIYLGLDQFGASATAYTFYSVFLMLTVVFAIFLEAKAVPQGDLSQVKIKDNNSLTKILFMYWGVTCILVVLALVFLGP